MPQLRSTLNCWTLIRRLLIFTCAFTIAFPLSSPARGWWLRGCLVLVAAAFGLGGLSGCVSVPVSDGTSAAAATSEAAVKQSWVDRHRDLFEEEAPYFGRPGKRRAVWSPGELSIESLQRIGFDTSNETLVRDERVPSVLGAFDRPEQKEATPASGDWLSIDSWPKRSAEWGDGAFVEFSTLGSTDIPILKLVEPGDPDTDCWMLVDTKFGALGALFIRRYSSNTTLHQGCNYAAAALEKYLEEFTLWLDEHPEFKPQMEAYGPRD